jgi:hypothetical protein
MNGNTIYVNSDDHAIQQPEDTISVDGIEGVRIQLDEPTDIEDIYQFCLRVAREMKPKTLRSGDLVADIMPIVPINEDKHGTHE